MHFWLQAALDNGGGGEHADVVVQSTHKMLAALTQASMLHIKGQRALQLSDRISRTLQVLQVNSMSTCRPCGTLFILLPCINSLSKLRYLHYYRLPWQSQENMCAELQP